MSGDENLWYVKTPDGDVHRVTLDQLDEAFQAGRIDGRVMVLPAGATKWATLGELAGLDEPAPPAPASVAPNSLRPMSMDLDADLDENAFRKKSRRGLFFGAAFAVLAAFGGILGANRAHLGGDTSTAAAVAVPVAPPTPVTAAAAPDPAPSPSPVATSATPPADTGAPKLSEEQKAKLAAADKALELKAKARKKAHAAGVRHGSTKYKAQGFTTSGNKFDPLNASM